MDFTEKDQSLLNFHNILSDSFECKIGMERIRTTSLGAKKSWIRFSFQVNLEG